MERPSDVKVLLCLGGGGGAKGFESATNGEHLGVVQAGVGSGSDVLH